MPWHMPWCDCALLDELPTCRRGDGAQPGAEMGERKQKKIKEREAGWRSPHARSEGHSHRAGWKLGAGNARGCASSLEGQLEISTTPTSSNFHRSVPSRKEDPNTPILLQRRVVKDKADEGSPSPPL